MSLFTDFLKKRSEWSNLCPRLELVLSPYPPTDEEDRVVMKKIEAVGCEHEPSFRIQEHVVDSDGDESFDSINLTIDQLRSALAFAEECLKEPGEKS